MTSYVVKSAFTYTFHGNYTVEVPAGARTVKAFDTDAYRWVDPSVFPENSIEHHDADYYGIRVFPDNLQEI